ncbi:hypothetical protein Gogos_010163, partial [Gossypium gossypioides]|nr:hypothetical protein [Gossypium gossypioides]
MVIPIVLEFYANLKVYNGNCEPVRGLEIDISPSTISEHYGILWYQQDDIEMMDLEFYKNVDMDTLLAYQKKGRGEWKWEHESGFILAHGSIRRRRSVLGEAKSFHELQRKQIQEWNQRHKHKMEMPPTLKKKTTTKKVDEGTQWQRKLFNEVCYKTQLLKAMKPLMDRFTMSHGIEGPQCPERTMHPLAAMRKKKERKKKQMRMMKRWIGKNP